MSSSFAGNAQVLGASNGGRTQALLKGLGKGAPKVGTKQIKKAGKAVQQPRKQASKIAKSIPVPSRKPGTQRSGSGAKGTLRPDRDSALSEQGPTPVSRGRDRYLCVNLSFV